MSMPLNFASIPEMYERWLVAPLFRPWVETLFDAAALGDGDRVLDIACGTGIVARTARERLGGAARIVGVDLSPQMLAVARRVAPDIEWREGSASALPLAEGEAFDAVLCQQGLQFFPDRPAAAQEMRRALAPGGRLAVATWRPLDETPFFRDLHAIAERHLGPIVDQRHAFGAEADLERLLTDAGFRDVRVTTHVRTIRIADVSPLLQLNAMASSGMSPAAKSMSEEARSQAIALVAHDSAEAVRRYMGPEGAAFELGTNVAAARR